MCKRQKLARELEKGDEVLLHDGSTVWVDEIYLDDDGVWVEWSDGDMGHVQANGLYELVN